MSTELSEDAEQQVPATETLMVVERFIAEQIEPRRSDFRAEQPLPSMQQLLGAAMARRRIQVKKITDDRWVFVFSGTVIGGYSGGGATPSVSRPRPEGITRFSGGRTVGVTTLVSAHARRVLRNDTALHGHFALMDVPTLEPESQPTGLRLRSYVVGREAVSTLVLIPPYETTGDQVRLLAHAPDLDRPGTIVMDVTELVTPEIASLAADAVRAVPGLLAAAVELQVSALDSAQDAAVIGIDEQADPLPHHFPTLGTGRDVADAIAEQILFTAAL